MRRCVLLIILIASTLHCLAQSSVTANIEPIEMMIGEQATVTLTVQAADDAKVEWPTFQPRQMLVPDVEVLNTQRPSDRTMVITLTSFDGNLYHLPPFKVKINGKEQQSADLALKVVEVEVDTTQLNKFFPPKDVQDNPFLWSDWSLSFWLSVLLLVLIALCGYLYLRLRDNKPIISHIKIVKRLLPHQKAMKEIEQIKADRMVASENAKEYYTKLTDTLRKYIEERYGFSAMEMTSSEIIERLTAAGDQQSLDELRQLFTTADLVKFDKYFTMINENDANLVSAIDFIQKERRVLKIVIWGIVSVAVLLFCYIVYSVWQLLV